MINSNYRSYDFYTFGNKNSYGQVTILKDENNKPIKQGSVKMAIFTTSQAIQENINYKQAQYIALTHQNVDDKMVIDYNGTLLKVLYISAIGRVKQVFLTNI